MKTNKHTYRLNQLEHLFAEDFGSPVFPLLADYYVNLSKFSKALKVCQIGLKHSPTNLEGQYVLSKIYIMNNKFFKAEQLLKHIVHFNQCNIEALIALIKIEIFLKRSPIPTISTSSPTFNTPRSILPVPTVPLPFILNTSSIDIKNGLSVSLTGSGI